jgi:hypothetical protein
MIMITEDSIKYYENIKKIHCMDSFDMNDLQSLYDDIWGPIFIYIHSDDIEEQKHVLFLLEDFVDRSKRTNLYRDDYYVKPNTVITNKSNIDMITHPSYIEKIIDWLKVLPMSINKNEKLEMFYDFLISFKPEIIESESESESELEDEYEETNKNLINCAFYGISLSLATLYIYKHL